MELGPRDQLSQSFVNEVRRADTNTPYGPVVHLDLRHLGDKIIDRSYRSYGNCARNYQGIDPVNELVPVRPWCTT